MRGKQIYMYYTSELKIFVEFWCTFSSQGRDLKSLWTYYRFPSLVIHTNAKSLVFCKGTYQFIRINKVMLTPCVIKGTKAVEYLGKKPSLFFVLIEVGPILKNEMALGLCSLTVSTSDPIVLI